MSIFASVINSKVHLDSFVSLANRAGLTTVDIAEAIAEIEERILWMASKAPEIEKWVNGSMKVTVSLATLIVSMLVTLQ